MGILDQPKATHVIHTTSRLAVITGIRVCVVVLVLLTWGREKKKKEEIKTLLVNKYTSDIL